MPRVISRYPSSLKPSTVYGTLGIPGVDEVHVIYEGMTWTPEEMELIEQRLLLPYMPSMSRCYLKIVKTANWNGTGKDWYYGKYYNWRFAIVDLGFEGWIEKMEAYHQQYSKRQEG